MKEIIQLLIQLQDIDLSKDAIEDRKGSLPKELARLEQELVILQSKQEQAEEEINKQKKVIAEQKQVGKEATELIAKYKQEHLKATDNKEEYDNITQDLALQELEVKLTKKKIRAAQEQVTIHNTSLEATKTLIKENKETTALKKESLTQIAEETQPEEEKLNAQRKTVIDKIEDIALVNKYENLRKRFPFVVASVIKDACNGCFIVIPTQRQIKIREEKKIFMCEHCNRMLVKAEQVKEEEVKQPRRRASSRK